MNHKRGSAAALAVALAVCLSGCGGDGAFFGEGEEVKYRTEQTIYLPMEKVRTLNPMISKDADVYYISKLVYDSLFELDEWLEPKKRLVESYAYSDDKLTLTLTLKEGVKWHDGEELTAADVKFSIDSYMNLSYSNETVYSGYVSNIRSVSQVRGDPGTVVVSFRNAGNVGVENLLFPILPSHQFSRSGDVRRNAEEFMPVGTGPYRIGDYNNLSYLTLSANEAYHGAVPKNELHFVILPRAKDAINLIDVENISLLISGDMDRDALTSNLKVRTVNFLSNQAEVIGFNFRSPIMGNKQMRQAVAHAVDSAEILESAYLNNGVLSDTIYYPSFYGNRNGGELFPYDTDTAADMISMAGFRDTDGDGYIDRRGEMVILRILVDSGDPARVAAAQIIKNSLDKLPLATYIIYCDRDEYIQTLDSGEYDLFIGGYTFNERYDLRDLLHTDRYNKIGYSNRKLDSLLDEMQSCVTAMSKAELFEEANSILKEEIPYYCILYKTFGAVCSDSLEGDISPLFNDYYRNSGEWLCMHEIPAAVAE